MGSPEKMLSCAEARSLELVSLLSQLGYSADKIKGKDHWYKSPLRSERTASFKVDTKLNRWYDFGTGQGGNTIDFGILYFNCSAKDFLAYLSGLDSFLPSVNSSVYPVQEQVPALIVTGYRPISSHWLIAYLAIRSIPIKLASRYCTELSYQVAGKAYYGIGFKNDSAGYEIRNRYFKASTSPKDFTWLRNGADTLAVFEGFFDFLSFLQLTSVTLAEPLDFLILNSLFLLDRAAPAMESYGHINLYMDHDKAGRTATALICNKGRQYRDCSDLYAGYEDLNDYLTRRPINKSSTHPDIPP